MSHQTRREALTMSDDEALGRWEDLHNHVTTQTGQAFVTTFLSRCLRSHTEQHLQSHKPGIQFALI
jgi:trehalose 6-phosphate synthase/phosphatase